MICESVINNNIGRWFGFSVNKHSNNLYKLFTDNTIFHAINWKRLSSDRDEYSKLSRFRKIWLGIKAGPLHFFRMTALTGCLMIPLSMRENPDEGLRSRYTTYKSWADFIMNVSDVIIEETVFRGGVQRGVASFGFSDPRIAVLGANTLFAWGHFFADAHSPGQGLRDPLRGFLLASTLTVLPTFSILYYTTGSLYAPIAAHVMSNATADLFLRMVNGGAP